MKKLMFVLIAATMMLASCSKENKLNKKLEGTWKLVSTTDGGVTVTAESQNVTSTMTFTKVEKETGTYSSSYTYMGVTYTGSGTYTLTEDTQITTTQTAPSAGTPDVMTVTEYTKTDMTLKDSDGTVYVMVKQ